MLDLEKLSALDRKQALDVRNDLKNKEFDWFKHTWLMFPKKEHYAVTWQLCKLNVKRAWNAIKKDYEFVFRKGGGEALRKGIPPQISLQVRYAHTHTKYYRTLSFLADVRTIVSNHPTLSLKLRAPNPKCRTETCFTHF